MCTSCQLSLLHSDSVIRILFLSHSYTLLLAMSTSTSGTTNQPGNPSENTPAGTGDGRGPDISAGGGIPPPEAAQEDDTSQVWSIMGMYRKEPTRRHHIYRIRGAGRISNRSDHLEKQLRLLR